MSENETEFLNKNGFRLLKEYTKTWGKKTIEYIVVEDELGYRYDKEKRSALKSIEDGTISNYRFCNRETRHNRAVYIDLSTHGDVKCVEFLGKSIKMYSKKLDVTWTKTWGNVRLHGPYNSRILEKNNIKTGYSLAKERTEAQLREMVGERFGRLTVIDITQKDCGKRGIRYQLVCKCDCGRTKNVERFDLEHGKVSSCGCLRSELLSQKMSEISPWEFHNSYKWYFYDKDGNTVACRSSYEVIYANYLVENGINFEYEPQCFKITEKRRYTPDFYLKDLDLWVEIKGRTKNFPYSHQEENRITFSQTHNLEIYFWEDLMKICGMKLKGSTSYHKRAKRAGVSFEFYLANKMYQQED